MRSTRHPPREALAHAADLAEAAQVAEMVGLMAALVSTTIDYVRTRRQFGVAIGTFQALQHRIADMWMACEETRSLAFAAALACGGPADGRRRAVSLAKIRACDAAHLVGGEAIQLHGGIGMTDELIVSHWYRRLLALRASLGDRRHYLNRIVADERSGLVMTFAFAGKVAVVTGAASGIGLALAKRFADEGMQARARRYRGDRARHGRRSHSSAPALP